MTRLLLFALVLPTFAADPIRYKIIQADASAADSCNVANNDTSLLEHLKKAGWKRVAGNFPAIEYGKYVALVVTTDPKNAKPSLVEFDQKEALIYFKETPSFPGTGVLVMQVRASVVSCARTYADSHSGSSISTNSASSDKPAARVEQSPTLNSKSPPID